MRWLFVSHITKIPNYLRRGNFLLSIQYTLVPIWISVITNLSCYSFIGVFVKSLFLTDTHPKSFERISSLFISAVKLYSWYFNDVNKFRFAWNATRNYFEKSIVVNLYDCTMKCYSTCTKNIQFSYTLSMSYGTFSFIALTKDMWVMQSFECERNALVKKKVVVLWSCERGENYKVATRNIKERRRM